MNEELKKVINDALVETFGDWCDADEFDEFQRYFWWQINRAHLPIATDQKATHESYCKWPGEACICKAVPLFGR